MGLLFGLGLCVVGAIILYFIIESAVRVGVEKAPGSHDEWLRHRDRDSQGR